MPVFSYRPVLPLTDPRSGNHQFGSRRLEHWGRLTHGLIPYLFTGGVFQLTYLRFQRRHFRCQFLNLRAQLLDLFFERVAW